MTITVPPFPVFDFDPQVESSTAQTPTTEPASTSEGFSFEISGPSGSIRAKADAQGHIALTLAPGSYVVDVRTDRNCDGCAITGSWRCNATPSGPIVIAAGETTHVAQSCSYLNI